MHSTPAGDTYIKSKLIKPFLDSSNILRVGGRIKHSNLPFQQKFPEILPKCQFTEQIITQLHNNLLHSGTQLTLSVLREILRARPLVKSIIHRCIVLR